MPFTTSHPALVLPLKKIFSKWLSLSGLIAGAMSPDLLYFIEMTTVNRGDSHSWIGLLQVCLPIGILFCFAFHWLVKEELIRNLPASMEKHFSGLAASKWKIVSLKQWIILIVSVIIGTLTHFFWDSFTHLDGVMVGFIPVLKTDFTFFGITKPGYSILQHLSTLSGVLGIIIFFSFKGNIPGRVELKSERNVVEKIFFWLGAVSFAFLFALLVLNIYKVYNSALVPSDGTVFGLAGWAGFFYFISGVRLYKWVKNKIFLANKSATAEY